MNCWVSLGFRVLKYSENLQFLVNREEIAQLVGIQLTVEIVEK